MSLNKTKIETCDYTWNPYVGCLHGCDYCYARPIANKIYGDFEPRFFPERLDEPDKLKTIKDRKPWIEKSFPNNYIIMVCSMGDLFGSWVKEKQIHDVLIATDDCSQHIFQFFTKNPTRIKELIYHPSNSWFGTSVDYRENLDRIDVLADTDACIKFVSFEPLKDDVARDPNFRLDGIDWVIIGGQTGKEKFYPPINWIKGIVEEAKKLDIPVFIKTNVYYRILEPYIELTVDFPDVEWWNYEA